MNLRRGEEKNGFHAAFIKTHMKQQAFSLTLAGVGLTCRPLCPGTAECFWRFRESPRSGLAEIFLTEAELEVARGLYPPDLTDAVLEFNELAPKIADALLPFRRCVFHGVAFIWRGRAYIFSAPSGTGKSTQYVLWKLLYGDEIRILNGDKPILEFRDSGEIWVHPSPWVGKECMGRKESAPLGGIIYLVQGRDNVITRLTPQQAAFPLYCQIIYTAETVEAVGLACALEERLLQTVPVWRLVNRGDEDSARLCHDTILQFEEGRL